MSEAKAFSRMVVGDLRRTERSCYNIRVLMNLGRIYHRGHEVKVKEARGLRSVIRADHGPDH